MNRMKKEWKTSLQRGEVIGDGAALGSGRWEVIAQLGEGGYAEVYEVRDLSTAESQRYALKIDSLKVKKEPRLATVRAETEKLKRLQSCDGVPRLVEGGVGKHHGRSYVVMELFSEDNLAVFQQKAMLSIAAIRSIGLQTLKLLQSLHTSGWLHRDVKPANFVRTRDSDPAAGGEWRILDFGLARQYISKDGLIVDAREGYNEFRGSTNYASIKAHQKEELGRRDDLWSWLYMLVELLQGKLLWRESRQPGRRASGSDDEQKKTAHRMKLRALSDPNTLFASGRCPEPLVKMSQHLAALQFKESPDYAKLQGWLAQLTSADATRLLQPPPGVTRPQNGIAVGRSMPAPPRPPPQAPAQRWPHPSAGLQQHAATGGMFCHGQHGAWPGGTVPNGGAWHGAQPQALTAHHLLNGWAPPGHHLGKQESLDGSFWTSHSSLQTPRMSNSTEEYVGQGSQQSSQIPQAVPSHLSAVPENWDQQLGQLGSEFGDEFDQPREPSMPPVVQRQQLKRPSDFQLFDALHADIAGPLAKRPRPSPAPARAPAAAPPHLLEEDASPLLHPPLPGSAAPAASAARPARQISPKAVSFAPDVSSIIPALDPAKVVALHHPPPPSAALDAIGRQKRRRHLPDTQVPPSPPSDPAAQGSPAARQDQAEGDGMASYGPAFLQSAISAFDEGRVSVNAKILKKLVPSMDPAEAYVGLGWAGWCLIHNTTPETQLQAKQMLNHLGDFFKSLARTGKGP